MVLHLPLKTLKIKVNLSMREVRILKAVYLRGLASPKIVAEDIGAKSGPSIRMAMIRLVEKGFLEKEGHGIYRVSKGAEKILALLGEI